MTLEELITVYQLETYEFYVDQDKDDQVLKRYFIFDSHQDYLDKYLGFYKGLGELTEVIIYATNSFFKISLQGINFFIKHGHQSEFKDNAGNLRGINPSLLALVKQNLIMNIDAVIRIFLICDWTAAGDPSDHLCIGSDFDGLIEPVECCPDVTHFEDFAKALKNAFHETIPEYLPARMADTIDPDVLIDKIMLHNAINLMKIICE